MITFFPTPYPDELLYSIIGRYHKISGNVCIAYTLRELFSTSKLTATIDFPCGLNSLSKNISKLCQMSVQKWVNEHTLLPVYRPFWHQKRVEKVFGMMKSNSTQKAHLFAGVNSYNIRNWEYLRYCPACLEEDHRKYGEAYWHRLHQIPGVQICPNHNVLIKNSTIRRYETDCQKYFCVDDVIDECTYSAEIQNSRTKFLVEISYDFKYLLNSPLESTESDIIRKRYINKLKEKGFVSQKGQVDQIHFVNDFTKHHTLEFLELLEMTPDSKNTHNWLSMMVRKYDELPHPLKHILLIRYLYNDLKEFYIDKSYNTKSFGKGPFPCLNPMAEHFKEKVIQEYEEVYSRNKNQYGIFKCSCGFIYERNTAKENYENMYEYSTVKNYGTAWENKFVELVELEQLHLREVGKIMKIDLKTVRKLIVRMGLYSIWMNEESKNKLKVVNKENKLLSIVTLEEYRNKWILLCREYSDYSKTRLKSVDVTTFNWLFYHDRKWFEENSPRIKNYTKVHYSVDWSKRDVEIICELGNVVNKILSCTERPRRITLDLLGKEIGALYLLKNQISKIPKTKGFLDMHIESIDDFRKRKVIWAIQYIINNQLDLKVWRVRQIAGLHRVNPEEIDEYIVSSIKNY